MHLRPALVALLAFAGLTCAWGQTVGLVGVLGNKALVMVDGMPPKSIAVGETYQGVTLLGTQADRASVRIGGVKVNLQLGDAPASVGSSGASSAQDGGTKIVLQSQGGGHFITTAQINGRTIQCMVDTGATMVTLSTADAQRIGLKYQDGQAMRMSTANGMVQGWRVKLASVRVNDVTVYEVDAIVSAGAMPYVLLGNSYLSHFQMNRVNNQLILNKQF